MNEVPTLKNKPFFFHRQLIIAYSRTSWNGKYYMKSTACIAVNIFALTQTYQNIRLLVSDIRYSWVIPVMSRVKQTRSSYLWLSLLLFPLHPFYWSNLPGRQEVSFYVRHMLRRIDLMLTLNAVVGDRFFMAVFSSSGTIRSARWVDALEPVEARRRVWSWCCSLKRSQQLF